MAPRLTSPPLQTPPLPCPPTGRAIAKSTLPPQEPCDETFLDARTELRFGWINRIAGPGGRQQPATRLHGLVQRQGPYRLEGSSGQPAHPGQDEPRNSPRPRRRPTKSRGNTGRWKTACWSTTARRTTFARPRTMATSRCMSIGRSATAAIAASTCAARRKCKSGQQDRLGGLYNNQKRREPARPAEIRRPPHRPMQHAPHQNDR